MKAALITAFIIIAALLALAFSCPDEENFDRWITKTERHEDDSLMAKAGGMVLSTQAHLTADYENHILWATVETHRGMSKIRYTGVFGIWFELSDS